MTEGPAERPGKARPGDGQQGSMEAPEAVMGAGGGSLGGGREPDWSAGSRNEGGRTVDNGCGQVFGSVLIK